MKTLAMAAQELLLPLVTQIGGFKTLGTKMALHPQTATANLQSTEGKTFI